MPSDQSFQNRWLPLALIVLILLIYSYPALRTAASTGSRVLPPSFAPDSSLYLNISSIKAAGPGEHVDPYYGTPIPSVRMGYLKFRLSFVIFSALRTLFHGRLWWTMLLWNLLWWSALCCAAWWFFRRFLPDRSAPVVLSGMALLMLFNSGVLPSELSAWIHLNGFEGIELPDIRPFFPQVPLPFLVLYLGLQVSALKSSRWTAWTLMGLVQFITFAIFPFATVLMIAITATAVLAQISDKRLRSSWGTVFIYGVACGSLDLLFLFHGAQAARSGAPGETSLLQVHWSILPHRIGGMWLVLALLAVVVILLRNLAPELKWPVLGLALGNLFLLIGDTFFSPAALQLSNHGGYFVHTTAAILLTAVVSAAYGRFAEHRRIFDTGLGVAILFLVLNGTLIARATYHTFLPANQEQSDLARALQNESLSEHDLVIARATLVDDNCSWAPLLSESPVLFCRNAQVLLTPEQNQRIQRFRQALYLYFTGKDAAWVDQVLEDPHAATDRSRLMFLGQEDSSAEERSKALIAIRTDLIPWLEKAKTRDAEVRNFLSAYHRIIVVDDLAHPVFDFSRLAAYLKLEDRQQSGSLVVASANPLQP